MRSRNRTDPASGGSHPGPKARSAMPLNTIASAARPARMFGAMINSTSSGTADLNERGRAGQIHHGLKWRGRLPRQIEIRERGVAFERDVTNLLARPIRRLDGL